MSAPDLTNRYLLFAGSSSDPGGGMADFIGTFASIEEAKSVGTRPWGSCSKAGREFDWFEIVDRETLLPVAN